MAATADMISAMADVLLSIPIGGAHYALGELLNERLGGFWTVRIFEQLDQLGNCRVSSVPCGKRPEVESFTRCHVPVAVRDEAAITAAEVPAGRFISSVVCRGHTSAPTPERWAFSSEHSHVNGPLISSERVHG